MKRLALIYYKQSKYDQAIPLYEDCLKFERNQPGRYFHSDTLETLHMIILSLCHQQKYNEGYQLYLNQLNEIKEEYGPNDFVTLDALDWIARFFPRSKDSGLYPEIEKLLTSHLNENRELLGPYDPNTLEAMRLLSKFYYGQDDAKAYSVLDNHLKEARENLGPNHIDTLHALELIIDYCLQPLENISGGGWSEVVLIESTMRSVEPYYEERLRIRRELSGPSHQETLKSMLILADCYSTQGKAEEGSKMKEEAFKLMDEFKEHDPDLYNYLRSFSTSLYRQYMD